MKEWRRSNHSSGDVSYVGNHWRQKTKVRHGPVATEAHRRRTLHPWLSYRTAHHIYTLHLSFIGPLIFPGLYESQCKSDVPWCEDPAALVGFHYCECVFEKKYDITNCINHSGKGISSSNHQIRKPDV